MSLAPPGTLTPFPSCLPCPWCTFLFLTCWSCIHRRNSSGKKIKAASWKGLPSTIALGCFCLNIRVLEKFPRHCSRCACWQGSCLMLAVVFCHRSMTGGLQCECFPLVGWSLHCSMWLALMGGRLHGKCWPHRTRSLTPVSALSCETGLLTGRSQLLQNQVGFLSTPSLSWDPSYFLLWVPAAEALVRNAL